MKNKTESCLSAFTRQQTVANFYSFLELEEYLGAKNLKFFMPFFFFNLEKLTLLKNCPLSLVLQASVVKSH